MSLEFRPTIQQATDSNIYRFMQKYDISSIEDLSKRAADNLEWFWDAVSRDTGIIWDEKYSTVLDMTSGAPWPKWFVGGKTNIVRSSLEKFARQTPQKTAYHFVSESGDIIHMTYSELNDQVNRLANGLHSLGVKKGDMVAIFMPMIAQSIVAILACAKIGAIQTIVFSGYGAKSLSVRLADCKAKVLFVSDGFQRKGKSISQKSIIQEAIKNTALEKVIVAHYGGVDNYTESKFVPYSSLMTDSSPCKTESMDSDDELFILYTSGTTGNPKGTVHTHGGFSVFAAYQSAYLIDFTPDDVLFWPADIGWITGLVWNVYGMLLMGGTAVLHDGALDYPDSGVVWRMLERYGVTIFGISPTAVRMYQKNGVQPRQIANLAKLKNIPTTGEPIDEDSWHWLFEKVGDKKIPIMNLSGGTEVGGAMLSVFPGMSLKPCTVGIPCPGIILDILDDSGQSVQNKKGYLVIKSPWPAMTRGLLNDKKRYLDTYWSKFSNIWFHGDYVIRDEDGLWYMLGRVDDVVNVSGHRLSTAEIEQAALLHPCVTDAASISIPDKITGEAIVLYVVCDDQKDIPSNIAQFVSDKLGKLARPKHVVVVSDLPKTRTGKILRRLLKAKTIGAPLGDITSLENPLILDEIKQIK